MYPAHLHVTATVLCLLYNVPVGWAAIFSPSPPHLSTVAWRPVPRRRMPRDATRPFSRSDSSSCAIRCRLLFEVFGALCFLLPWRAGRFFLSLPLSLLGYYWLRAMELEGSVVAGLFLSCLHWSAWSWARAWARPPGYASRTAKETVSLAGCSLAPLRAASTYQRLASTGTDCDSSIAPCRLSRHS